MNRALKKKEISRLINASFRCCGLRATVILADQLMQNGFRLATRGGISIAIDDMLVPPSKQQILTAAWSANPGMAGPQWEWPSARHWTARYSRPSLSLRS